MRVAARSAEPYCRAEQPPDLSRVRAGFNRRRNSSSLPLLVRSEWYGYHFPELIKIVADNSTYCRLARHIGNRKELTEESLPGLEEVAMDGAKAQTILDAARSSMGAPRCLSPPQTRFLSSRPFLPTFDKLLSLV